MSMVAEFIALFQQPLFVRSVEFFILIFPIIAPFLLGYLFFSQWLRYIQKRHILSQKYVLLEIRPPAEVAKSPLAMEAIFNSFHFGPSELTWWKRYVHGNVRPWWSFEIVSLEGNVHFYVWTREAFRNYVEAQFYAQYPGVEVFEVADYTKKIDFEVGKTGVFACDFVLQKPDAYPIRTYVDYGLDKDPKEEFKVDPIAHMLEFMGTLGKGEQMWIQILIRQEKSYDRNRPGKFMEKTDWVKDAERELQKIRADIRAEARDASGRIGGMDSMPTPIQKEQMEAIERSIHKLGFSCGIRSVYISYTENFNATNIPPLLSIFKQLSSNVLNGFAPAHWLIPFDHPWQDFNDIRQNFKRKRALQAYRMRSWFNSPFKTKHYTLTTEELATIYHLPGSTVHMPTLARVASKRGEAPLNLPR